MTSTVTAIAYLISLAMIFIASGLVVINFSNELYLRETANEEVKIVGGSKVRIPKLVHRSAVASRSRKLLNGVMNAIVSGYTFLLIVSVVSMIINRNRLNLQLSNPEDFVKSTVTVVAPLIVLFALLCVRRHVHLKAHLQLPQTNS